MKYVIIGNGAAGINAAETIRRIDPAGSIIMITDEAGAPYCRPIISLLLEGSIKPDDLLLRGERFYGDLKIDPVPGERVIAIDVDAKSVTTHKKKVFPFDKLLIATGAHPRPIKAKGLNLKNIFFMRTESHVRQILEIVPHAKAALVLGGGLVSFKAAYGLFCRGLNVTMLIGSGYPLSMQVDKKAGKMILDELLDHGLEVKAGADAIGFDGEGKVAIAHISDGTEIPCDVVVVGKGVLPAVSFVPRDRIQVGQGIQVNQNLETSAPGIFAAGDVAESFDIASQAYRVNAIWPEAVNQGRIAGMNMAGRLVARKGSLGRNVIRIFGIDVMTGGLFNPPSDSRYRVLSFTNPRFKTYRKLVFCKDRLVGMIMVNSVEQGGILVSLIENEIPIGIPGETLLEPSFNYKQLMI